MLSRRAVMIGTVAASASLRTVSQAQNGPGGRRDAAPWTILRLQRRTIEINGRPASVFDIRQPDGSFGITTDIGKPFRVSVENRIDEPSLIHWHGLTPPWQQDGVPGVSGPAISPGGSAEYDLPLRFGGTLWMHSPQGLQEQLLGQPRSSSGVSATVPASRRSSSCWPISASLLPTRSSTD